MSELNYNFEVTSETTWDNSTSTDSINSPALTTCRNVFKDDLRKQNVSTRDLSFSSCSNRRELERPSQDEWTPAGWEFCTCWSVWQDDLLCTTAQLNSVSDLSIDQTARAQLGPPHHQPEEETRAAPSHHHSTNALRDLCSLSHLSLTHQVLHEGRPNDTDPSEPLLHSIMDSAAVTLGFCC